MGETAIFIVLGFTLLDMAYIVCSGELPKVSEISTRDLVNISDKLYYLTPEGDTTTINAATDFCHSLDMKLLSVEMAEEEISIREYLQSIGYGYALWTSGRRITEDIFMWYETGQLITDYTNWDTGEPRRGDCLILMTYNSDKWRTHICDGYILAFMCEQ